MEEAEEEPIFRDRIHQDPQIMVGKPVIRGTRIPVARIVAHLAFTPDFDDVFAAFPRLTMEDVRAALKYAADAVDEKFQRERQDGLGDSSWSDF
jgi:uncharacterized protein (DUF433 family)